jgi:hypothetical protein
LDINPLYRISKEKSLFIIFPRHVLVHNKLKEREKTTEKLLNFFKINLKLPTGSCLKISIVKKAHLHTG